MIDSQLLNPDGRSLWDCYLALAKRYRFSKSPQHLMDMNSSNALEFSAGTFAKSKKLDLRVGLSIYNNAVVADTLSSTDDAELFLQDVAQWAAKEYALSVDTAIVRKSYLNHMDVKFDYAVQIANPKLDFVVSRLNAQPRSIDGKIVPFGFGSLALWTQHINTPQGQAFRLEHKHDTAFTDNTYFSIAPLQTQEHTSLLEDIEKALKPS
jgi:hypothetical protein